MVPAARVEALLEAGKLAEAASVLAAEAEHQRAAELFEEACEFGAAARQLLLVDKVSEAARLCALAADDALNAALLGAARALTALERRSAAAEFCAAGLPRLGGQLLRELGAWTEAGEAFEDGAALLDAAACYDRAELPARAARLLEEALRGHGPRDLDAFRLALGGLYQRRGKLEGAVRVLQQVEEGRPLRRAALGPLRDALAGMGLGQAQAVVEVELASLGGAIEPPEVMVASAAGEVVHGRYRVQRLVATTPHARLLQAVDLLTEETVALKILVCPAGGTGRDALARFAREAQALSKLRHPNVVALREYLAQGPTMVMPWYGGGSVRELLEGAVISPERAVEIARAVLSALAEAHRLGILHRDIKPANVLLDGGGAAALADFGAAHLADAGATITAGAIGTVAYMAPEQRAGKAASVQADIFGVGVLLFEMLTGALPPGEGSAQVSTSHPDLSSRHDGLIQRFMAVEPTARYGGAREAQRALESIAWPTQSAPRRALPASSSPNGTERPLATGDRLRALAEEGRFCDTRLERQVLLLPCNPQNLARAAAFARAGDPALPLILQVDPEQKSIWVAAPASPALAEDESLAAHDIDRLRAALSCLHRVGGVHGLVSRQHIYRHAGDVYWAYPQSYRDAAPDDDLAALAALSVSSQSVVR